MLPMKLDYFLDASKLFRTLKQKEKRQGQAFQRAVKRAGLLIQRESQKIVPVDTGNLKNGARTRAEGRGFDTKVTVSYQAAYAVFVHEDLNATHKKGKTAKFLERAVKENYRKIRQTVRDEVRKA